MVTKDGLVTKAAVAIHRAVINSMSGREFREWFASSRAISGKEFYRGRP